MTDLSTLTIIATTSAAACYAIAIVQLLMATRSNASPKQTQAFPYWGLTGAALHLATIAISTIEHQGLSSSLFDALSITAFIVMSMGLIAQTRYMLRAMLIPAFIIAIICLVLASSYSHHTPILATSSGMLTHILSSIIAYSLLSIATLLALTLQLMERGLKDHREVSWLRQLPPLQTMENLLFQLITIGWLILTTAIISGGIFIDDLFAQHLAHKTLFTSISWLLYGLLLIGRRNYGWRGTTAFKLAIAAFIALLLAYFGSKFVLEILLSSY
jgi:ABC-type uncharacterized transport system permease subunit